MQWTRRGTMGRRRKISWLTCEASLALSLTTNLENCRLCGGRWRDLKGWLQ